MEFAAAEAKAMKQQKILIFWQPAVCSMETHVGRPFKMHLSYSDIKSIERLPELAPSCITAAHKRPTLVRGYRQAA